MDVTEDHEGEGPTMDVTPRQAPPVAPKRRALGWGLAIVLVAAVGFLLFKGLTEASVFFLNVGTEINAASPYTGLVASVKCSGVHIALLSSHRVCLRGRLCPR